MKEYDPKDIEPKWQKAWEEENLYSALDKVEGKENEYVLSEFAYPSGNLHVGHWYAFAVPDVYARYRRMQGRNVLYPVGFDAFGLPAENAAIKNKINPREWTLSNVEYMRKQLRSMGSTFDWEREVVTCSPEYYKWTQWLFLKLFEKGLAYQSKTPVNWCPSCKTVLANEQVVNGRCERCGTEVEKRDMLQWQLRITDYAERLIDDLEALDWPESIKESQRNWIGRSKGAEINFELVDVPGQENAKHSVKIFTTRPDTIFGATFVAVSAELASKWLEVGWQASAGVKDYIIGTLKEATFRDFEEKEKTGVYAGFSAINPATREKIPVWITNYVLGDVGTGAIMAVPADDERDREFAEKFELPIIPSEPKAGFEDYGARVTKYKLRDWSVSRQRYWGCPIPVIHCEKCGAVPVPDQDLPVLLPDTDDYLPSDDGKSPLSKVESFVNTNCPQCGGEAKRETDTLDTFVDSSWYFLAYLFNKSANKDSVSSENWKLKIGNFSRWMPVDFYSGGAEHTTMHLLYSRFFHKVLFDLGLVNESEPYKRRMNRGLILGPDGQKMSKRWGNVIDPDEVVARLGADTVRAYLAFIGPYNEPGSYPWNPDGVVGVRRFLERVWRLQPKVRDSMPRDEVLMHQTIKKVSEDIASMKMNTAVSALMIYTNGLERGEGVSKQEYETLLLLLAPFAPHIAEELWHELGNNTSIHTAEWPQYDEAKLVRDEVTLAVQIDGKVRATLTVSNSMEEEEVKTLALQLPDVSKWLGGKEPKRVIVIPGKIVSIVS